MPAKGAAVPVPRALTIATSDSGGGAGIQADLKAFAAAGAHGMSVLVALTAQNTTAVTAIHELPPPFVVSQLDAVFSDLGVDAAKTGMLFSARLIETVADYLGAHPVPLVVDPVMVASSGAQLLESDAVEALVERLFPLATVVTPNLPEAIALAGIEASRRELAERLHELGAPAVVVTGGHGTPAVDHLFDGDEHGRAVNAGCREGLQVGLDPRTAARVGRCNRQGARNGRGSSLRRHDPDQVRRVCSQPRGAAPRSLESTLGWNGDRDGELGGAARRRGTRLHAHRAAAAGPLRADP